MSTHLTQSQLESYLWGAATLLRGHIDVGDYKQFIFPLLFYKCLCDVYDEGLAEALEASGGDAAHAALPEQHRFQIPPEAHWSATRAKVKNVGKAIWRGSGPLKRPIRIPSMASLAIPSGGMDFGDDATRICYATAVLNRIVVFSRNQMGRAELNHGVW